LERDGEGAAEGGGVLGAEVGLDAARGEVHGGEAARDGVVLLSVKGAHLKGAVLRGGALGVLLPKVVEGFAEEARRADRSVVKALAELRGGNMHDGTYERAGGVIPATVAPRVAHIFDLGLVEVGEFVLPDLRAEAEFVDVVDDFAQIVAALDAALNLHEDFANLVFDGIRSGRALLKPHEVGEELLINKDDEVGPLIAAWWSILPSFPLEAAHVAQRKGLSKM